MNKNVEKLHGYKEIFHEVFKLSLSDFFNPIAGFDIIKFDDQMKLMHRNYEDERTSLKNFLKRKYGEKSVNVIEGLIS